eukprot:8332790-Heterocapsa_arctica.AAC.1
MRLPRPPRPSETGYRTEKLPFHPSHLRQLVMAGIGLRLGLQPPADLAGTIPTLLKISDAVTPPSEAIYIGRGNFKRNLAKSRWATPFRPGPHGSAQDCVH